MNTNTSLYVFKYVLYVCMSLIPVDVIADLVTETSKPHSGATISPGEKIHNGIMILKGEKLFAAAEIIHVSAKALADMYVLYNTSFYY